MTHPNPTPTPAPAPADTGAGRPLAAVYVLEWEDNDYPNDHTTVSIHATLDGAQSAAKRRNGDSDEFADEWHFIDKFGYWLQYDGDDGKNIIRQMEINQ